MLLLLLLFIYWWFLCCRNGCCSWFFNGCPNYMCIPCTKLGCRDLFCPVVHDRPDHEHGASCKVFCGKCVSCGTPVTKDTSKGCHAPWPRNKPTMASKFVFLLCTIAILLPNLFCLFARDNVQASADKVAEAAIKLGNQFWSLEEYALALNESASTG